MNKLKALSVLFRCAELYRDNLVGNNLLFVCSDKHLNVKMFPVAFLAGNFMHLTGVKFKGKAQSSVAFYNEYKMSPTSISGGWRTTNRRRVNISRLVETLIGRFCLRQNLNNCVII